MVSTCSKQSVKRSHSIQKSKSLEAIAEEGHVLQPVFCETRGKMKMSRVGINDASAFPGFCEEHERLFSEFERDGKIESNDQALLQTYRSMCREVVHCTNELDTLRHGLSKYVEIRNSRGLEFVKHHIPHGISINIDFEDRFMSRLNAMIKKLEDQLIVWQAYNHHLSERISNPVAGDEGLLIIEGATLDYQIPLALCGIASVGVEDRGTHRVVYCLLNIIPTNDATTIIMCGLRNDVELLEPYWKYYTQNNISLLNMVESFMIHGSDHWFIRPSVWQKLSPEKQQVILDDIIAVEKSFIDQFTLSVFDEIRGKFLAHLEDQQKWAFQGSIEDLIAHEKLKFEISNHGATRTVGQAIKDLSNALLQ